MDNFQDILHTFYFLEISNFRQSIINIWNKTSIFVLIAIHVDWLDNKPCLSYIRQHSY